jgi:hypothetical protein
VALPCPFLPSEASASSPQVRDPAGGSPLWPLASSAGLRANGRRSSRSDRGPGERLPAGPARRPDASWRNCASRAMFFECSENDRGRQTLRVNGCGRGSRQ